VEPSRFWLRRDDDNRARQVVFDEVQLGRYSERQQRAILKAMARGKTSQRDIRQAARRARLWPRGETMIGILLAATVIAAIATVLTGRHHERAAAGAAGVVSPGAPVAANAKAGPADLTTDMERADRAWLSDVGAGKVVAASDGSDTLSLPQSQAPAEAPDTRPRGPRRPHHPPG
jgi:hypothetical protein